MEITTREAGDALEVSVTGRLDAYWADHLGKALDEAIRGGADRIRLDMAQVSFISSVGIRVLLKFYKQLQRIKGSFVVSNPSEAVKTVLELAGLDALLAPVDAGRIAAAPRAPARSVERGGAVFEVFELTPQASLRCRVVGEPELLDGCRFGPEHCSTLSSPAGTFGVGLGAFGRDFADCQARFGEFLTAAGAAAYLPTDGTDVPDYLVSAGALVPELKVLYALVCEGSFAALARFESRPREGRVGLSDVADACLEIAGQDSAGMVMVAESAGLVGAALRRSPALAPSGVAPFGYPEVREWLSFTPERAYPRSLALAAGVATRAPRPELAAWLRPMRKQAGLSGHFHGAAFSYRPLQKGAIDLAPTVSALFEGESLQGVLHLIADDRDAVGVGESEFVRGACWIAPIAEIVREWLDMNLLIGAWTIGLILSLLALGVFISFRVFSFSDITTDGSITLGACLAAVLLVNGMNPLFASAVAFCGGVLAGATTGILHTKFRINPLLSGILVMTALYSVNLHIMGRSNIPLLDSDTIASDVERAATWLLNGATTVDLRGWEASVRDLAMLLLMFATTVAVAALLYVFFRTNVGTAMRATGQNPQMIRALGVDVGTMTIVGLALANGLIALSGALLAQYQGFADVQMGIGMVVWGLASVIIGEALVGTRQLGLVIAGTVMGSVLFRLLVAIALRAGLNPNDLKLITAAFVFVALVFPDLLSRLRKRGAPLRHA